MKIRKFLIAALLAAPCIYATAAERQALKLQMVDDTEIVYFLDEQPKITLSGQTMTVITPIENKNLPIDDVRKWTFGLVESDVEQIKADRPTIFVNGGTVSIIAPRKVNASIYRLDGTMVSSAEGCEIEFNPGSGIFVIKIDSKSYKIAIR